MKNIFLFLISLLIINCSFFIAAPAFSQKVLLSQNVQKDSVIRNWGPNRKNFMSLYIGLGGIIGNADKGATVLYNHSSEFTLGMNYKKRLSNYEAIGYRISYDLGSYRLKPNSAFDTTKTLLHKKEKLAFNSFSLALYNRVNFDKRRGNHLGHYLDIGAYGSWYFSIRHHTKDDIEGKKVKTITSHLPYTENFGYGVFLNLGFNNFIIYSKYRISDNFKDSKELKGLPEMPRYILGIIAQLGN